MKQYFKTSFLVLITVKKFIFLIFVFTFFITAHAQHYSFRNYSVSDGLGQNQVISIFQDSRGFMWFGTNGGGVTRFDGYKMENFTTNEGIPGNKINNITEDSLGRIWFATNNGIGYYDGVTVGKLTVPDLSLDEIYDLCFDKKWNLWVGLQNHPKVFKIKMDQNPIKLHDITPVKFSRSMHTLVMDIFCDSKGFIWLGTNSGLINFDANQTDIEKYELYTKEQGLEQGHTYKIFESSNGQIWLGTQYGLCVFNSNRKIHCFSNWDTKNKMIIYSLTEDRKGNIWAGGFGSGAIKYNIRTEKIEIFDEKNNLPNNYLYRILTDHEGGIWFGTYGDGAYLSQEGQCELFNKKKGLSEDFVWALLCDKQGNIWAGTDQNGINLFADKKFQYINSKNGLGSNRIRALFEDKKGNIWVGAPELGDQRGGVSMITKNNLLKNNFQFKNYTTKDGLISNNTYSFFQDFRGSIWIGSDNGLSLYDGNSFHPVIQDPRLKEIWIYAINEDLEKNIWFGTFGAGLFKYYRNKPEKEKLVNYTVADGLANSDIRSIIIDKSGNLWIGTGGGISIFDGVSFRNITTKDGLKSDRIYIMYLDGNYLYIGSNIGIDRFDYAHFMKTGEIKVMYLGHTESLATLETNTNGVCQDTNGDIWFGTLVGLLRYHPKSEKLSEIPYPLNRIKRLKLHGTTIEPIQNKVYPYFDNNFTFEYVGITYIYPKQVSYKFKLDGIDKNWSSITTETIINYSNLQPGNYTFQVKACNLEGNWDSIPATYSFTITPPYWQTWWFRIGSLLFVLISFYTYIKNRERNLKNKQKTLELLIHQRTTQIEEKNKELEKLSIVASETHNGVILADPKGELIWANKGFTKMTGFSLEEFKNLNGFTIQEVSANPYISKSINQSIKEKKPSVYETVNEKKDGTKYWVQTTLTPILGENGNVKNLVIIETDISERKNVEMELEKLSLVASETANAVILLDPKGQIEWVNNGFTNMFGYTLGEITKNKGAYIFEASGNKDIKQIFSKCIQEKKSSTYETKFTGKNGKEIWVQSSITPIFKNNQELYKLVIVDTDITAIKKAEHLIKEKNRKLWEVGLAVNKEKEKIEKISKILEEHNTHITDIIKYAKNIQEAILPTTAQMNDSFVNYFILFQPKDIVSGDFYWQHTAKLKNDIVHIMILADCTGHGVPGAFMSMIGNDLLNQEIIEKKNYDPAKILLNLHEGIKFALKQTSDFESTKDGMDIAICAIYPKNFELVFAGAMRHIWYYSQSKNNDEILEVKGNIFGIGGVETNLERYYSNIVIKYKKEDIFYLSSDGITDQFGGPKSKRLTTKRFLSTLNNCKKKKMIEQKEFLLSSLNEWQGNENQTDDILVIGFQL